MLIPFQVKTIYKNSSAQLAWHAFRFKHLINQAVVQFHGEDEFTDSTANIQPKNKEFQHHLLKTYFQTLDLVFHGMACFSI